MKIDQRCPRKLEKLPIDNCQLGEESNTISKDKKNKEKLPCEWFINSKENHYCYWVWSANNHNSKTPLENIAGLINSNIASVNVIISKALEKLGKKIRNNKQLFKNLTEQFFDEK